VGRGSQGLHCTCEEDYFSEIDWMSDVWQREKKILELNTAVGSCWH
jgi:hypothetical protein